jgi:two-component system chemotaxis response regulator CheY
MSTLKLERYSILVVDDDTAVREIIVEYLKQCGFRTFIQARDGAEAYRYIADPVQRIDLIISDWEMPRTDGLTLLRAVRSSRQRAHVPFIMVTSQQSQERLKISKAIEHRVDQYIVKPFRGDILREKVWKALDLSDWEQKVV